jgi:hypothetical protein
MIGAADTIDLSSALDAVSMALTDLESDGAGSSDAEEFLSAVWSLIERYRQRELL